MTDLSPGEQICGGQDRRAKDGSAGQAGVTVGTSVLPEMEISPPCLCTGQWPPVIGKTSPGRKAGGEAQGSSLFYFLQLHMSLQLSQNKEPNFLG